MKTLLFPIVLLGAAGCVDSMKVYDPDGNHVANVFHSTALLSPSMSWVTTPDCGKILHSAVGESAGAQFMNPGASVASGYFYGEGLEDSGNRTTATLSTGAVGALAVADADPVVNVDDKGKKKGGYKGGGKKK